MDRFFHWIDQSHIRQLGVAALLVLIGVAIGNSHKTNDALVGQAQYFVKHEQRSVNMVAGKVAEKVRHEDAHVIGVSPEVLKGAVDAAKVVDKK